MNDTLPTLTSDSEKRTRIRLKHCESVDNLTVWLSRRHWIQRLILVAVHLQAQPSFPSFSAFVRASEAHHWCWTSMDTWEAPAHFIKILYLRILLTNSHYLSSFINKIFFCRYMTVIASRGQTIINLVLIWTINGNEPSFRWLTEGFE